MPNMQVISHGGNHTDIRRMKSVFRWTYFCTDSVPGVKNLHFFEKLPHLRFRELLHEKNTKKTWELYVTKICPPRKRRNVHLLYFQK